MPDGLHGLEPTGDWQSATIRREWKADRERRGLAAEERMLRPTSPKGLKLRLHELRDQLRPNLAILTTVLRHPFSTFEHPAYINMLAFKDAYRHCQQELARMTSAYEVMKRSPPVTQVVKAQPSTDDVLAFTTMQAQRNRAEAEVKALQGVVSAAQTTLKAAHAELRAYKVHTEAKLARAEHILQNQKLTSFERILAEE